jgi:hypothetical protein
VTKNISTLFKIDNVTLNTSQFANEFNNYFINVVDSLLLFIPIFLKRFISKKICIIYSKKNSKIVLTTNLNNCVYFNKREIEENINNVTKDL